eukprot:scaffold45558_cov277-Skeletonema_marinoi.AAC.3
MTKEEEIENYSDLVIESIERAQEVAIETKSLMFFKANVEQYKKLHSRLDDLDGGASGDPYGHPISNVTSMRIFVLCVCWAYVWNREIKLSSNPVSNKAIQELHRSGMR